MDWELRVDSRRVRLLYRVGRKLILLATYGIKAYFKHDHSVGGIMTAASPKVVQVGLYIYLGEGEPEKGVGL